MKSIENVLRLFNILLVTKKESYTKRENMILKHKENF